MRISKLLSGFIITMIISGSATAQQIYLADNGLTESGTGTSKKVSLGGALLNTQTAIDFGSANTASNFLIKKGTSNYFFIQNDGNIGIGNAAPAEKLQVNGKIRFGTTALVSLDATTDGLNTNIRLTNPQFGSAFFNAARFGGLPYSATNQFIDLSGNGVRIQSYYVAVADWGALDINTDQAITGAGLKLLTIKNAGVMKSYIDKDGGAFFNSAVNIGAASIPSGYKLAVGGSIIAEKLRVKLQSAGWPDYVFTNEYRLRPLNEVEKFIQQNKHLPDVPSAKQVGDEGIDVGDNQAVLLKKIEELTLYLIEQNKQLNEQNKQIESLQNEVKSLKEKK